MAKWINNFGDPHGRRGYSMADKHFRALVFRSGDAYLWSVYKNGQSVKRGRAQSAAAARRAANRVMVMAKIKSLFKKGGNGRG